mgnify:CR=1 FL=1
MSALLLMFDDGPPFPRSLFAAGEQGIWLDPSDFSTLFQDAAGTTPVTAVGQPVGKILDKSGRGNHATQSTGASRPTLQQDSNGLYYLSFDGTDDGMATPSINFTGTDKMTVWAGAQSASTAATAIIAELSSTTGAGNPGSMAVLWPRLPYAVNFGLAGTAAASRSTSASADTGLRVISCAFDISSASTVDEIKPRVNGAAPSLLTVDAGPAGTGNFGNYPLYIGRRGGTSLPFNGRLYQLIVRGAESNAGQIAATEAYVNAKTRAY